jgi:hypothetical protein
VSVRIRAHFDGKTIVPDEPLDLASDQDLEVSVRIVPKSHAKRPIRKTRPRITSLPFYGMWADREDMADSTTWVRKERERWSGRLMSEGTTHER